MKLPPVSVLETWPKSNYLDPETRGNALTVFNSVCLGLMTIILGLRLYTRVFVKKWFGWDDFYIVCAYVGFASSSKIYKCSSFAFTIRMLIADFL